MKLEVGKFYRTRDGRKIEILREADLYYGHRFVALMTPRETGKGLIVTSYAEDGTYSVLAAKDPSSCDIVAEWREPAKVCGWINFYQDGAGGGTVYSSRDEADRAATVTSAFSKYPRIACIYVSGEEGKEP
jgi:hypothetical protein